MLWTALVVLWALVAIGCAGIIVVLLLTR